MPDLYKYSNSFEPILLENMTATLFGTGCPAEGLNVVCKAVGALPEYYKNFGELTADTWDTDNEDTNLEMRTMELAQIRMRILDDIKVRLYNPGPVQQWRSKTGSFYLPKFPVDEGMIFFQNYYWKASEFFVFEDNTPRFSFHSEFASSTSRVLFSGWRLKLGKITTVGKTKIYLSDWPTA